MGLDNRIMKLHPSYEPDKFQLAIIEIDGSELPNGTATTAGVLLGKNFCVARDDGSNTVTITFNEKLEYTPRILSAYAITADGAIDETTASINQTTLVYASVKKSDHGVLVDMDVRIILLIQKSSDLF